ncbi:MAG: phage holin [Acetobacterium sp.]
MNFKVRLRNKTFWVAGIALIILILQYVQSIPVYESNGLSVDAVADAGEQFGLKTIRYYDLSFVHFQYNE